MNSSPAASPDAISRAQIDRQLWHTVVWDDPINLMSYVTQVFRQYFGMSTEGARALMMRIHLDGSAVVSSGTRERMEADVVAMQEYGLRATLEAENS